MTDGYRRWIRFLSVAAGFVLTAMGTISVLVFVTGLVSGDPDITDNVSGAAIFTVATLVPGWLLVRWGRRGRRTEHRYVSTSRNEYEGIAIPGRDPRSGRLRLGRLFSFSAGLLILLFGGMALLMGVFGLATAYAGGIAGGLTAVVATNIRADWFRW